MNKETITLMLWLFLFITNMKANDLPGQTIHHLTKLDKAEPLFCIILDVIIFGNLSAQIYK